MRPNLQSANIWCHSFHFVPPDSVVALCGVLDGVGGQLLRPAALRQLLLRRQKLPEKTVRRGSEAKANLGKVFLQQNSRFFG